MNVSPPLVTNNAAGYDEVSGGAFVYGGYASLSRLRLR